MSVVMKKAGIEIFPENGDSSGLPATLVPIKRVLRSHIPWSYFALQLEDNTSLSKPFILSLAHDPTSSLCPYAEMFSTPYDPLGCPVLVFAKLASPKSKKISLVLVAHVHAAVWSITRLHKHVSMKDIRGLPSFDNPQQGQQKGVLSQTLSLPHLSASAFMGALAQSCALSPVISSESQHTLFLTPPSTPVNLPQQPQAREHLHVNVPPVHAPRRHETQLTTHNIDQYVKQKYYESLYISKTPISYFAKSTLSRARAVCNIDINNPPSAQDLATRQAVIAGIEVLIPVLSAMLIALHDLDSKYERSNFSQALAGLDQSNQRFAAGAYEELELKCFRYWKKSALAHHPDAFNRGFPGPSGHRDSRAGTPTEEAEEKETTLESLVDLLKVREIQLQLIVVLEILALYQVYSELRSSTQQDAAPGSGKAGKKNKKKKKRRLAIGPAAAKAQQHDSFTSPYARPVLLTYRDGIGGANSEQSVGYDGETDEDEAQKETHLLSRGSWKTQKDEWDTLADILFDRLCIWQAIAPEPVAEVVGTRSGSGSSSGRRHSSFVAPSSFSLGSAAHPRSHAAAEADKAQEFCREVVLPFFSARLREKCRAFIKTAKGISGRAATAGSTASRRHSRAGSAIGAGRTHSGTPGPDHAARSNASFSGSPLAGPGSVAAPASSLQLQLRLEEMAGNGGSGAVATRKKSLSRSASMMAAAASGSSLDHSLDLGQSAGNSPRSRGESPAPASSANNSFAETSTTCVSAAAASRRRSGFFSSARVVAEDRRQFAFVRRKKSAVLLADGGAAASTAAQPAGPAAVPAPPKQRKFGASFTTTTSKLTAKNGTRTNEPPRNTGVVIESTPEKKKPKRGYYNEGFEDSQETQPLYFGSTNVTVRRRTTMQPSSSKGPGWEDEVVIKETPQKDMKTRGENPLRASADYSTPHKKQRIDETQNQTEDDDFVVPNTEFSTGRKKAPALELDSCDPFKDEEAAIASMLKHNISSFSARLSSTTRHKEW